MRPPLRVGPAHAKDNEHTHGWIPQARVAGIGLEVALSLALAKSDGNPEASRNCSFFLQGACESWYFVLESEITKTRAMRTGTLFGS